MSKFAGMKSETYERQKAYASGKQPSMTRRMLDHDYAGRQMYMVTMTTEGRRPLFGQIVGHSEATPGTADEPRCELSQLGQAVAQHFFSIPDHYPKVEVIALQMMPDHLHGILFVREQMAQPLGMVIRGFKTGCNKDYRRLVLGTAPSVPSPSVPSVATLSQQTKPQQNDPQQSAPPAQQQPRPCPRSERYDRHHGLLFSPNYCDKLLLRAGQLDTWLHYLQDNPRRLLMKREHPDLFRVRRNVVLGGTTFSALGNLFLAQRPVRLQVQCSRRMTEADIAAYRDRMLHAARQGAVLVSPSISPGEKAVMRAAFDEGLPLIYLQENGLTDLAKPVGRRMEACASGQLLILAPWEHHNEHLLISRTQCLSLNDMARQICEAQ